MKPRAHTEPLRGALALALALSVGACSALRFGGPDYDLAGSWEGSVTVDGQRIPGSLAVEQDGRELDVAFVAPDFDLTAEGSGTVGDGGTLRLELEYDLQCPGVAVLTGMVSEDERTLAGDLEATDCTGSTTGTFRFTR